jgi:hypothetical protein
MVVSLVAFCVGLNLGMHGAFYFEHSTVAIHNNNHNSNETNQLVTITQPIVYHTNSPSYNKSMERQFQNLLHQYKFEESSDWHPWNY